MSDDDIQTLLLAAGHEPETPISAETLRRYSHLLLQRQTVDEEAARVARDELAELSAREREIVVLVCKGMNQSEVGKSLGITEKTVNVHMANIRDKLEMTTIEAAVLACKAGWL